MHHLSLMAIVFFIAGDFLHALAQIDAVAKAKKMTRRAVLYDRWISLVVRGCLCTAIFVIWLQGQLADFITSSGFNLPATAAKFLDIHISGAIATVAGYAGDSILGYIPALNKIGVPPAIDQAQAPVKP